MRREIKLSQGTAILLSGLLAASWAGAAEPLTRAIDVRSLSVASASSGLDTVLTGVVTYIDGPSAVYFQDETAGSFFRCREIGALRVGDQVEVRGKTRMGLYLPGLDYSEFKIIGQQLLPTPIPASFDDLISGRFHYQRVSLEGVVRVVAPDPNGNAQLRLALGSRVVEVRVSQPPVPGQSLVDHRVRVTGLAVGVINPRRQLVRPRLHVLGWSAVEVLAETRAPGEVPRISAEDLLAFHVTGHDEKRVQIDGIVLGSFPGGQLYLRQNSSAFGVRLWSSESVAVGETISVMGFPEMDRYNASVVDAELVRRDAGTQPAPLALTAAEIVQGLHDGNLVTVEAVVSDLFRNEDGASLLLRATEGTFQARLPVGGEPPVIGSLVRVTGILQVESVAPNQGFGSRPQLVVIRLRTNADLATLRAPTWWTPTRLAQGLGLATGVALLAGLWITILRRQVSHQTAALRQRIESEAALEERHRIAREFHDSLEQELAGLRLRLDAIATRNLEEKAHGLVVTARSLVSRIQIETRNLVSDLRAPEIETGGLQGVLTAVAEAHRATPGLIVQAQVQADLPSLPASTLHHLRMIARESVTNAIKHAQAGRIDLRAEMRREVLVMSITDDGVGFDPGLAVRGKAGHFGCIGIQERARKIGGEVAWRTAPGTGTRVEVSLVAAKLPAREPAELINEVMPSRRRTTESFQVI